MSNNFNIWSKGKPVIDIGETLDFNIWSKGTPLSMSGSPDLNFIVYDEITPYSDNGEMIDYVLVEEYAIGSLVEGFGILVYEAITIQEDIVIERDSHNILVFENITTQDYYIFEFDIYNAEVFDDVYTTDFPFVVYEIIDLTVLDPYHVLITEHTDILDLIVEVGVVMEALGVAENFTYSIPNIDISLSIVDTISITENSNFGYELISFSVQDNIFSISEQVSALPDVLNVPILSNYADFLCHFDTRPSNNFVDSSKNAIAFNISRNLNTTVKLFGAGSMEGYLYAGTSTVLNNIFGGEKDFKIEFRYRRFSGNATSGFMEIRLNGSNTFTVRFIQSGNGDINLELKTAGISRFSQYFIVGWFNIGQWYTIGIQKKGRVYYLFVNGVYKGTVNALYDFFSGASFLGIGYVTGAGEGSEAYYDEFYYKIGNADWTTAGYTPIDIPYTPTLCEDISVIENIFASLDVLNKELIQNIAIVENILTRIQNTLFFDIPEKTENITVTEYANVTVELNIGQKREILVLFHADGENNYQGVIPNDSWKNFNFAQSIIGAKLSTAQKVFGKSSLYNNITTYASGYRYDQNLNPRNGNFFIEGRLWTDSSLIVQGDKQPILSYAYVSSPSFSFFVVDDTANGRFLLRFAFLVTGNNQTINTGYFNYSTYPKDMFHTYAVAREGSNLYFFIDGTLVYTHTTLSGDLIVTNPFICVGSTLVNTGADYFLKGYLDEVVYMNIAYRTASYTVPTVPYVGMMCDEIAISENVNVNIYSLINSNVNESISIEEYVEIYKEIAGINVVETLTISEFVNTGIDIISVNLYENISSIEYLSTSLNVLNIVQEEAIIINEVVTKYLTVLYIYIYEDVAITEDILSYLPVNISIEDSIAITDDLIIDKLYHEISVVDNSSISDYVSAELGCDLYIYNNISISEDVSQYLSILNLEILEPFHVLITEHTDVLDLVVEVGVVMEAISVSDERTVYLDQLNIFNTEDILIEEVEAISLNVLYVNVFEEDIIISEQNGVLIPFLEVTLYNSLVIEEDLSLNLDVLNVSEQENIAVIEDIIIEVPIDVSASDDVAVDEFINMVDITIELGVVSDDISIQEILSIDVPVSLSVEDSISTEEEGILYIEVLISVFDNLLLSETISTEIPISIDQSESIIISEALLIYMGADIDVAEDLTIEENITLLLPELFANVLEPFHVVITEHTDIVDLVVEVGIVMEAISIGDLAGVSLNVLTVTCDSEITITEELVIGLDIVAINVYEDVQVVEYNDELINILHVIAQSDIVTISETTIEYLTVWNTIIYEEINITEDVAGVVPINISALDNVAIEEVIIMTDIVIELGIVTDNVTVEENFSAGLSITIDRFDDISVAESITIHDIIIELGIVYEEISISETAEADVPIAFSAIDNISIQEYANILDIIVELEASDNVTVSENVAGDLLTGFEVSDEISAIEDVAMLIILYVTAEDAISASESVLLSVPIDVSQSEEISVIEAFLRYMGADLGVEDSILVQESAEMLLPTLILSVLDPYHVVVTEHTDVLDLVVEVGIVMEALGVADEASAYLDILNLSIYDGITISEYYAVQLPEIFLTISQNISVNEFEATYLDVLVPSVSDDITILEIITLYAPIVSLVFEEITVSEYVNMVDIVIELGVAVDTITVSENVVMSLGAWNIEVSEIITSIEQFVNNMPINFEVAEQRGICIVTVSGW